MAPSPRDRKPPSMRPAHKRILKHLLQYPAYLGPWIGHRICRYPPGIGITPLTEDNSHSATNLGVFGSYQRHCEAKDSRIPTTVVGAPLRKAAGFPERKGRVLTSGTLSRGTVEAGPTRPIQLAQQSNGPLVAYATNVRNPNRSARILKPVQLLASCRTPPLHSSP
jgi:hypothetical protein